MKIEVAQHARMSERGSSLLRLIQNNDMPLLDLLVRESVQNSLDAANANEPGPVKIAFNTRDFSAPRLGEVLEGIEENLARKFPEDSYKLLEIKDSNTTGLTGPLHYNEVIDNQFGNLLKLIYEISMPQQKEGAGGSWGLGKTVYFRVGIGLVFYYSRVKDNQGGYVSRLAACLVEDEQKEDALINLNDGKPKRGIAWWGQLEDAISTKPLTDDFEIAEILHIFNTAAYTGDETGTTIIIPFINEESLLEGILPTSSAEKEDDIMIVQPWWTNSVHDYLITSLQRWYSTRLANERYPYGKWLRAYVNDQELTHEKMLPLFKVTQELYNHTPLVKSGKNVFQYLKDCDVTVEKIALRNIFSGDTCAGYLAFVKLSRSQLLMNHPNNHPSPFIQANMFESDSDSNSPIMMYVRKPGMIVRYETAGAWTEGIPKTNNDEFILGLFAANSENTLKNLPETMTIEQYIRKSEKADHTSWTDWSIGPFNPLIISKVQRKTRAVITLKYNKPDAEHQTKRNTGLGKVLAQFLLPPENFGSKASAKNGGNKGSAIIGKSLGHGAISVESPQYENGSIKVNFVLNCGSKNEIFELQLQVLSEFGGIKADTWEEEENIGKPFPMKLENITINRIQAGKKASFIEPAGLVIDDQNAQQSFGEIVLTALKTERFETPYGARLHVPEKNGCIIHGTARFTGRDEKIQGGLILEQGEGEAV